ncbi:unnamed protein product [Fusarium venenatum]|uniref:WSC domain-containing protein n=1 Tax=Fusarium venenatum TaxID=56646 RepID=A0A2L2SV12_9HYPO|nr:uncharacterized protein FVRRES_04555 [Fusarium venenatum]CEI60119.1 unnamed protein product [Fusarium venenatum]
MKLQQSVLAVWVSVIPLCFGLTLSPATGGLAMARILFGGSTDVFASSSGYSGDPSAIRPFTDGPFGMEKGIILSTGSLTSPLAPGDTCPNSYTTDLYDAYTQTYCGANSYNGASYLLNILPTKATTLLVDIVIASCDISSGDRVMVTANGVNYAKDENDIPLDSSSKYLSEPWGIPAPNGDTAFAMSSPSLRFSIPLPKTYVELKIAICDRLDGYGDTAVMIKARPCNNCDQPFKVDYDTTSIVSTTTYETTSTITQQASRIARGTISYVTYITASATSTTSSSVSDSTSAASSATSSESGLSTSSTISTSFITHDYISHDLSVIRNGIIAIYIVNIRRNYIFNRVIRIGIRNYAAHIGVYSSFCLNVHNIVTSYNIPEIRTCIINDRVSIIVRICISSYIGGLTRVRIN